ncbi:FAD-dependent monooxygenase [Sphingomonas arantia]|uniref:FAD-dependent monooxygenase n=1 Tax=Sphingomonas arantia TaxID=1460676 RepID=A0ABW4U143_9SPHN
MDTADVIILGGGLVGLTLASALDAHGLTSIVVDPADPAAQAAPAFDGRASAVASASWRMLQAIGVADRLEGQGCPIRTIRVTDGLVGGLAFDADPADGPLGIMFENRVLRAALRAAAVEAGGVTLLQPARPVSTVRDAAGVRVTLDDGRVLSAPLLIAAEGRGSPTREAAGIRVARWQYDHHAIIGGIHHERPHDGVAHEIFYPAGPFAILPMRDEPDGRHRSAIVWSVAARDGPALLGLPDRAFAAEAEKRMGGLLGAITTNGARASYPLGFHHAAHVTGERLALVGDAAHGIHPIAGQGLNLGFRDVAALVQVLVEAARLGMDPGDAQSLARYERWRALDTFLVASTTDGLTRLFGLGGKTAATVRRFGLAAVQRIPPLKDRFMAEARGESGDLPDLLAGRLV